MKMYIYITNPIEVHQGQPAQYYLTDYPDHKDWYKLTQVEFDAQVDRKDLYGFCRTLLGLKSANVAAKQEELQNERAALIKLKEELEKANV